MLEPDPVKNQEVVLLDDKRFNQCFEVWKNCSRFGFDLESYSTIRDSDGALSPNTGEIRLIQIAVELSSGSCLVMVIDLGWTPQERTHIYQHLEKLGFWKTLRERLANPKVAVVGHAMRFEQAFMLAKYGFPIRNIIDTQLLSQVYWAGLTQWLDQVNNRPHSLESVCLRLAIPIDKTAQTSDWGWGELGEGKLSNRQINYAAIDASVVLQIYDKLKPLMEAVGAWKHGLIECGASPAFAQMEHYGMPVDSNVLQQVITEYESVLEKLLSGLQTTFPEAIAVLNSPKALKPLINAKFQLNLKDTSAETLSVHWRIPSLKLLSLIRTQQNYINYLKGIARNVKDGRVKGSYNQIGQMGLGRSNCHEPNLQNPPHPDKMPYELRQFNLPSVRSVFVAPPGHKYIINDLMGAHTAIAAQASGDKLLIQKLNSPTGDAFCVIAAKIATLQGLGKEWTEENIKRWKNDKTHPNHPQASLLRSVSKNAHYGCQNGSGPKRHQETVRVGSGIELSLSEAKLHISSWKKTYSTLAQFQWQIVQDASKFKPPVLGLAEIEARTNFGVGCVKSLSGRYVFLPKYPQDVGDRKRRSVRLPDACAAYWTITEATVIKLAKARFIEIYDQHPEWVGKVWIGNSCHDELDVIAAVEYACEVAKTTQEVMRWSMSQFISLIPVHKNESPESIICDSWADKL
ncbi:hypothetical protein WA1_50370 [Scytonema hofmannii PCC 7110]|uniref:DNA polymerase I n=2 Tax=Scytonema hofmannii TaxID=34078 RepID=A0A139WR71_9CYAN|nr:hypothetical protein WA1_50370 [Scytonema hofmannii PCC 7110]